MKLKLGIGFLILMLGLYLYLNILNKPSKPNASTTPNEIQDRISELEESLSEYTDDHGRVIKTKI